LEFLKKCLKFCVFVLLLPFFAYCQKGSSINGSVSDADSRLLASASIFLLQSSDSSIVKLTVTSKTGTFSFADISPGSYCIKVTYTGYKKNISKSFVLKNVDNYEVGTIVLSRADRKLGDVNVVAGVNFIETRGDKIILNIQNSILSAGNNALEILKRSPGVKVGNNDEVSLNGKSDVLILIDNKPTYLSGTALSALLQGTQSSTIDKIELINNPNSTYDAGGTGGVINIRLKRDKSLGMNASVMANTGLSQPGDLYPTEARGGLTVNFNYRSKALNVFGNYSYSNTPVQRLYLSSRLINYNGQTNEINVDWFYNYRRITHNYRLGLDYNLSVGHVIGVLINGSFFNQNGQKNTASTIIDRNGIDSTIATRSDLTRYQANATYDVNYRGNFGKGGELSFDGNYINYIKHYNEQIQSDYFLVGNGSPYRNQVMKNASPSNYSVYVFSSNYHLNISKENDFNASIKSTFAKTDNFSDFGRVIGGVYTVNTAFSSRFKYNENINAANVDYVHSFNKKFSLELGLRTEQTIADGNTPGTNETVKSNYVDLFPNIQLTNVIDDDNQLILSYSRRITRPKWEDLNPLLTYVDQYTYQIGNPYLKPFYSNAIDITHTFKSKFSTRLTASFIKGFAQTVFMQNDQTKVITLKKINLGDRYNYGIIFNDPVTFTDWYNVDFNLSLLYQRFTGSSSGGNLDSASPDVLINVLQHIKLPLNFKAEVSAQYESPTTYGILRYQQNTVLGAGISKSIFHKQGTINFTVDDIFNSDKGIYYSNYQNLSVRGNQKNNFRLFQLNFTYSFGSQLIKATRRRNTGAEEEQGRANAGTN
jgi:iron complex outermembrane receptor protein